MSDLCNKTYHLGCARAYLGSKSARGCWLASLSNSHQGLRLTTITQPVNNTASGNSMPSNPETPLFSFSNGVTVQLQYQQAATVSEEISRFNNLDSGAKMSQMYEFMFTHMMGLESWLNEVARTTSNRFSQVDACYRLLSSGQSKLFDLMPICLPTRDQLSHEEIVTRIFNFIGATRFLGDLISIRKLNIIKENESSNTSNNGTAALTWFSLILRFKSVQVLNEP